MKQPAVYLLATGKRGTLYIGDQVAGDADVERASFASCEDVDGGLLHGFLPVCAMIKRRSDSRLRGNDDLWPRIRQFTDPRMVHDQFRALHCEDAHLPHLEFNPGELDVRQ